MPTEVLYRKWRPQRFADVSGQELITRTLLNAVQSATVSHAYLFAGPRGTGKTTTARLLAKAINCERNAPDATERPGEPCNECASCRAIAEGSALDLIELDAASNRGIDDIRELRDNTNYMPSAGGTAHKVYLIDEVHMLTEPAFNALLKTLEEPPVHVIFILATTDAHKVPATIVSRCQRYEFKRIPHAAMVARLTQIAEAEGMTLAPDAVDLIVREATGSLRDAINLLEQVCDSFGKAPPVEAVREALGLIGDERALQLARQALQGDLAGGLATIAAVRDDGLDLRQFQKEVVLRLRALLHLQSGASPEALLTAEQASELATLLDGVPAQRTIAALRAFGTADLKTDPLSPVPLELALADTVLGTAEAAAPSRAPAAAAPAPSRAAPARPARQAASTPPRTPSPPSRADLRSASAEDIAAMLGSTAPVIPPAGEASEPAPAAPAAKANGTPAAATASGELDLETFVDTQLRPLARKKALKYDALLNGSCRAVSFEDGVLTLGFYADAHHKKTVEAERKVYEQLVSQLLGSPVTIRCIITPKLRIISKSPLVQHAVETHGAKIVERDDEEP